MVPFAAGLKTAPRRRLSGVIGVGVMLLGLHVAAVAQTRDVAVAPEAQKGARQEELEKVRAEQKRADEAAAKLKAELDSIGEDRRKLNALLIDSAAKTRTAEERIAAAETRLKARERNEAPPRRSLASRKAVIAEVLAALQRLGHRPPPALMVSPEDALQSVGPAVLLGAVLHEMKI